MGSVIVVVNTTLDPTETGVFSTVLVRNVAEDAEFKVMFGFAGVEVEQIFSEGAWLSPRSGHSLKGEWDSRSVCTRLICTPESEFRF
jgi:hypothetical protein